jgi:hypothetical protein
MVITSAHGSEGAHSISWGDLSVKTTFRFVCHLVLHPGLGR